MATTVIEVGVDVPNASLMVIENASAWGFRNCTNFEVAWGVGHNAVTVCFHKGPLSHTATSRPAVMRESTDGFVISEKDLELRGWRSVGHTTNGRHQAASRGSWTRYRSRGQGC